MLRALQFAVRFGFTIEPKTAAAIKKLSDKFQTIAPERILGEFKKAWVKGNQNTDLFIELLDDLGVGETLFGKDFQPKAAKMAGAPNDLTNANFVSFFLLGGDPAALRPTNEMLRHLELGRELMSLGLKGPQIGQAQQDILRAIHSGEIKNEPKDIEDFLQRKVA
jgi:tRNA nucleotidyltransferase/poly(A) polymerase